MYGVQTTLDEELGLSQGEYARRQHKKLRAFERLRREELRRARQVTVKVKAEDGPPGRLYRDRYGHMRYEVVRLGIRVQLAVVSIQHPGETR